MQMASYEKFTSHIHCFRFYLKTLVVELPLQLSKQLVNLFIHCNHNAILSYGSEYYNKDKN